MVDLRTEPARVAVDGMTPEKLANLKKHIDAMAEWLKPARICVITSAEGAEEADGVPVSTRVFSRIAPELLMTALLATIQRAAPETAVQGLTDALVATVERTIAGELDAEKLQAIVAMVERLGGVHDELMQVCEAALAKRQAERRQRQAGGQAGPKVSFRRPAVGRPHEVVEQPCPYCQKPLAVASIVHGPESKADAAPAAGDMTLCIQCGEWLVFGEAGASIRKPSDEEFVTIAATPTMAAVRSAWSAMDSARQAEAEKTGKAAP